ncbi:hypothetical protein [Halomonas korlensis]|uniref:hypothetical protein n=1 Tax=Halomonas korlensis TaxID=463301 RepID=UPI000B7CCDB1|nr:hypothetical protein [Halomonas korlensis]
MLGGRLKKRLQLLCTYMPPVVITTTMSPSGGSATALSAGRPRRAADQPVTRGGYAQARGRRYNAVINLARVDIFL